MMRVRPGRGASFSSAAMPPARKRFRQRAAFSGVILIRWSICWFSRPSAASSTIRARSTHRAGMERARAIRCRACLCSEFSSTAAAVRILSHSLYDYEL